MHFNKPGSRKGTPWTVHFRGVCYAVKEIRCLSPMRSEWKPNKRSNPRAFFTTLASELVIDGKGVAVLS